MNGEPEAIEEQSMPDRWTLIRDFAVFQVKLVFDGMRDVLLVPVSLIAAVVSLVKGGASPSSEFYDLLRFGHRSERWINLFGAASQYHGAAGEEDNFAIEDIDVVVSRVEAFMVDEYRKGGVTAQAKDRLDRALDALHKKTRRRSGN
jgi:hypothetical protein